MNGIIVFCELPVGSLEVTVPFESLVQVGRSNNRVAGRVEWRGFVPQSEVATFFESVVGIGQCG